MTHSIHLNMTSELFQSKAVYTIIPQQNISDAYLNDGNGQLVEKKIWATASADFKLLANNEKMALLLASASNIIGVEWIAQIDDIHIDKAENTTTVNFSKLTKLSSTYKLSSIKLRNGTSLSSNHIRPYVLTVLPKSLFPIIENWKPQKYPLPRVTESDGVPSYWVMKGNPRENQWNLILIPGEEATWHTGKPPRSWTKGDRIFCWESSPARRMVGFAELINPNEGHDKNGHRLFQIRYLSSPLDYQVTIDDLRLKEELKECSFLKSGAAGTVFPITRDQATVIYQLIFQQCEVKQNIWPDLLKDSAADFPDVDDFPVGQEGRKRLVQHFRRERNGAIIKRKKEQVLQSFGKITCSICDFDFGKIYGELGKNFCEVHHLIPLAEGDEARETNLSDLIVICSNCHRMIHKLPNKDSLQELRSLIEKNMKGSS